MSLVLRRSYLKAKNNVLSCNGKWNISLQRGSPMFTFFSRIFCDDKFNNNPEFSNSTIFIESGSKVQELPVVVRKLKDITEVDIKPTTEIPKFTHDSLNYHLIQAEFRQCVDLRDVFSLLSKCTKITPNIALGAMERIYDLEKDPSSIGIDSQRIHINLAKGAILDKLLKVVLKTEDTSTILNILNIDSSFMEPYKYKFCDELLLRVIDNKLSVEQLCDFITFLIKNKMDTKYCETIDKLWVGFIGKEADINETNIVQIFTILPGLKASKRTILNLLEQKLMELWCKIDVSGMQEILSIFIQEKYSSFQSFAVVGRWLNTNIHALNEDSMLDIVTKLTRLNYTDNQVESAVEKYMRLRGSKVESQILVVSVLNYCMLFKIRNKNILNVCSEYFLNNATTIPHSFLKSFIFPYGFLYFDPPKKFEFWKLVEEVAYHKFEKMHINDLCSIILSCIYVGKYPLKLVSRIFNSEYLLKVKNSEVLKRLNLIDTALSLECSEYTGPLLPKDKCSKSILQDNRIKNIIDKTKDSFTNVAGGADKLSTAVSIPYLYSDETYLIDVMLHPAGLGSNIFNWKLKSVRNENVAILIHLPEHYCSDNEQLIGPQMMRKKHLRLLGMKVVSLNYSALSKFYMFRNTSDLTKYLIDNIKNAEQCI